MVIIHLFIISIYVIHLFSVISIYLSYTYILLHLALTFLFSFSSLSFSLFIFLSFYLSIYQSIFVLSFLCTFICLQQTIRKFNQANIFFFSKPFMHLVELKKNLRSPGSQQIIRVHIEF